MKKPFFLMMSLFCVSAAQAQVKLDMKPGLWEHRVKISGQGMEQAQTVYSEEMKAALEQMKKQMENMPPEQREAMERAMSGMQITDQGVEFDGGKVSAGKDGMVIKNCLTQEQINRGEMTDIEDGCQSTLTQLDKNRFKSRQVCDGLTSESVLQLHSSTHYTGQGKTIHTINGETNEVTADMEGKWLASDCGDHE